MAPSSSSSSSSNNAVSYVDVLKAVFAALQKGQLPAPDVIKLFISRSLGLGILAGSCVTKLPQILSVVRSGSAAGLSPLSFELEALGLTIHSTYGALAGLPFSSYGEASILCVQSLLLLALIYRLAGVNVLRVLAVAGAFVAFVASVLTGRVGLDVIRLAFDANNLVFIAAKVPQIWSNFRSKQTGQLSLTTCSINLVGCIARIFTSIAEGAGPAMVRTYIISLVLNSTLTAQILLYSANTAKARAQVTKKKKQ